jgi:hypothetical protein
MPRHARHASRQKRTFAPSAVIHKSGQRNGHRAATGTAGQQIRGRALDNRAQSRVLECLVLLCDPGRYRGRFRIDARDPEERAYNGEIGLSWVPTPRIQARGERASAPGDAEAFLKSIGSAGIWQRLPEVHLPDGANALRVPCEEAAPHLSRTGVDYLGPTGVYPPEIGDGTTLTRVTGLIPNGWDTRPGG